MQKLTTIIIQNLTPDLDCGKFPLKRSIGGDLCVEADIFKEGHAVLRAVLKWRFLGERIWNEGVMFALDNNRWRAAFPLLKVGLWEYTIEAWWDRFLSWQQEIYKKVDNGIYDLHSEALEGVQLIEQTAHNAKLSEDVEALQKFAEKIRRADAKQLRSLCENPELATLIMHVGNRYIPTILQPFRRVRVDRQRAVFSAWYEFFPRSAEGKAASGSMLRNCLNRIDDAKQMGFDVIYFPPIHPIGITHRKGKNNALKCLPGDPGVPYAIGNFRQGEFGGGHRDIAPELGTMKDFEWLISEVQRRDMEIALDFAINCSPDHPYLREHPEWFFRRLDNSIKYAENPPKKYEDIYPLNFYCENWKALWEELYQVLVFWCAKGVHIFRVDNPHTKPVFFWKWIIAKVQKQYPQAIFLSEAFTHPKMMQLLAKVGFTQSYTYFLWRNTKQELIDYFTELTQSEMKEFFRPNLFTNTPDILPNFLQHGGRAAFQIRAILAATLSPVYGIYSGFELCEDDAIPGREEYLDSEKYQFKQRDWNAAGNIKHYIRTLNKIRQENRALRCYESLRFHPIDDDHVLLYSKSTPSKNNVLLIVVNLDPRRERSAYINVPVEDFSCVEQDVYHLEDLLSGEQFVWSRTRNYVTLDPYVCPARVLRLRRWYSHSCCRGQ